MAVRFDAATDRISVTAALPDPATAITVLGWAYLSADTGTFATLCRVHAAAGASTSITFATNGAAPAGPAYFTGGGSITSSTGMPVGAWRKVAVTCTGGSGVVYVAVPGGATDVDTGSVGGAASPTGLTLAGRSAGDGSEPFNGRLAYWRVWSAALSQAEVEAEWSSTVPVRTSGLWADWPLLVHTDLTDHSGNGRHLSAGTTATTTEDGPPIAAEVTGTAAAALGGLSVAAAGTRTVHGTIVAQLGGLTAAAVGTRTVHGTAAVDLGSLTAAALVAPPAAAPTAGWGGLLGVMRSIHADALSQARAASPAGPTSAQRRSQARARGQLAARAVLAQSAVRPVACPNCGEPLDTRGHCVFDGWTAT